MSSSSTDLTERQRAILTAVVEDFIATGNAVGSKNIAGRRGLSVSASTIRAELGRLEEMGLLNQPHTSAGRVPTDLGYRHYSEELIDEPGPLPARVEQALSLDQVRREVDQALGQLADALAQATNLLGVVTSPAATTSTVRRVEVLSLQPQLVMVVVITSTGGVIKRVLAFDTAVEPALADWAGDFLNERLTGEGVGSRRALARLTDEGLSPREQEIIGALAPAVTELEDNEECVIHVGGRSHFLSAQRAGDIATIDALMTTLEERYAVLELLRSTLDQNEVYLRVGSELGGRRLAGISMVAANYGVAHRNLGTVSLFGPSRMDYRLAIPAVRRAASILSEYVDEVYE